MTQSNTDAQRFDKLERFSKAREGMSADEAAQFDALAESLAAEVWHRFAEARSNRQYLEQEWLKDLRQYEGEYEPAVVANFKPNQCQAFIRLTRAKVRTMDARMSDMLFPASAPDKFWSIRATPIPELDPMTLRSVTEHIAAVQQEAAQQNGQPPEPPTQEQIEEILREAAADRVEAMRQLMNDQIKECRYVDENETVIHEGNLYGTGILKGPMVETRTRQRWVRDPGSSQHAIAAVQEARPFYEQVSLWDIYPDMDARHIDDCEYIIQRRLMPRHKVKALKRQRGFMAEKIDDYLRGQTHGDAQLEPFEQEIRGLAKNANTSAPNNQYEVLEYWGIVDGEELADHLQLNDDQRLESYEVECWVLGPTVIKIQINPTAQQSRPYKFFQFESVEGTVFGRGIAAIMRDTQTLFNAAIRMMVDNAARAAGPVFEVDDELTGGQRIDEIVPWQVIRRKNGASADPQQQALRIHRIPSMIKDLMALASLFKQLGDETTTLPSYMAGEIAGSDGAADTASGLSMLMGAANITVKDVIASFDQGVTKPAIYDLYHYNMQFHSDEAVKGDMEVIPEGSRSLVAKELRTRQIRETLTLSANPTDQQYINRHAMWKHLQQDSEMPEDVVWSDDEFNQIEQLKQQIGQLAGLLEKLGVNPQTGEMPPAIQQLIAANEQAEVAA